MLGGLPGARRSYGRGRRAVRPSCRRSPIVEPEVLMDGTHPLERCAEVTTAALRAVYDHLGRHRVVLEANLHALNRAGAHRADLEKPVVVGR